MANIIPLPNTRVSNLLLRQRLVQQYSNDQLDLFRVQEQISTGQRIVLPSDDAPAALRAIALQSLLERKNQLQSNITTGQTFLAATDSALADVATKLSDIRGATLGVAGTIATDSERAAAIADINGFLESLVGIGNRQFRGRFLFAGNQTSQEPYAFDGDNVLYRGNESQVRSYSDIGVLFASNAPGADVFGGASAVVQGSVALQPQLTHDTLLSSLHEGRGITSGGSIAISDGTKTSIVDLNGATTVGDVIRKIQENPPTGLEVNATISGNGLSLSLSSGNIVVSEVGTGRTAEQLGIKQATGTPVKLGDALDPVVTKTTRLSDLLGTKARATLQSGTANDGNDILITASVNGLALDGVTINVVSGGDIGNTANVSYDGTGKVLTIEIDDTNETSANTVVNAINDDGTFTAELDLGDNPTNGAAGSGVLEIGATATTSGGSGSPLDQTSGLRITNGGETYDIDFVGDETVEDLLNSLNSAGAGLLAEINTDGSGINIRSRLSGNNFQIGENGGQTATQLGLRTLTGETRLGDLNFGVGVPRAADIDLKLTSVNLTITSRDGQEFVVDLSAATDEADIVNAINAVTTTNVTAQPIAGGGVELVDNTVGTGLLDIQQSGAELGFAASVDLLIQQPDFSIETIDGQTFFIDLDGLDTVDEVLTAINTATGGDVTAQLAAVGNGIELVDNTVGAGQLSVQRVGNSQGAEYLGLIPPDIDAQASTTGTLTGSDRNPLQNESVFNTLIRLRDALEANDITAIERALGQLDTDIERVTFARADVGARQQGLQLTQQNLETEEIQLRSALSEQIDVDLLQAISELTARQLALEASLRASANILQLSLLNFI